MGENVADVTGVQHETALVRRRRPARARFGAAALGLALLAAGCSYTAALDPVPLDPAQSSTILAADGTLLARLDLGEHREAVALSEMAPALADAVVAIEDHRFWERDSGVDLKAIGRALQTNVEEGRIVEGGSTITQQYVRNVLLTRDQTVHRKLREAVLSIQLERKYTKAEILERYLNEVYFGNGAYGAQAAADRYFAKPAAELQLHEAALLAGVLRAPSDYDPIAHPDTARRRRDAVLDAMSKHGFASPTDVADAKRAPIEVSNTSWSRNTTAPYFVEAVKRWFLANPAFGTTESEREQLLYQGGLRIETTLDLRRQFIAEAAVRNIVVDPANDPAASLVSIDPDNGHVVAYVGGHDYWGEEPWAQFDLAGQAKRPTGSTFKPFVLTAALTAGIPLDREFDAPAQITIPLVGQEPWVVNNYGDEGFGKLDLLEATVRSVNTVYAQLIMAVTPTSAIETASAAGVRSDLRPYPSAALGLNEASVVDLASAYSTFAADGLHAEPVIVTKVVDARGTVLHEELPRRERVFDETIVRTLNHVLEQVVTRGTGAEARIGRPVAGKTGTSDDWKDAWFVGSTPQLTTAVWVGFVTPEPMLPPRTREKITGGTWPARIFALYMEGALAEEPSLSFPLPDLDADDPSGGGLTPEAPIADVVRLPVEAATDILEAGGYTVEIVEVPDREYPPGTVLAQSPDANTAVAAGSTVRLTVAGGAPDVVAVPDLLGLLGDEAIALAAGSGLQVEFVREAEPPPNDVDRRGRIWQQSPGAGLRVDEGATVRVWVNPT